jgi:hypothetical protein
MRGTVTPRPRREILLSRRCNASVAFDAHGASQPFD